VVSFFEGMDEGRIGVAFPNEEAKRFLLFLAGGEESCEAENDSESHKSSKPRFVIPDACEASNCSGVSSKSDSSQRSG